MQRLRKLRAVLAIKVAAVACFGALGGGALAVAGSTPAHACTYGPYSYSLGAQTPFVYVGAVYSWNTWDAYPDTGCGVQWQSVGQSKVCGFWGCSWENKVQHNRLNPPAHQGDYAIQTCRSGRNRYRSKSSGINLGGPFYYSQDVFSSEPEFVC